MTQRLPEAVLARCLPLTPAYICDAPTFTPAQLHVTNGMHVTAQLARLHRIAGTDAHVDLIADCLDRPATFRLVTQAASR